MATDGSDPKLSRTGALLMSVAFLGSGAAITALAAGWIPSDPRNFEAPRWVVGCAGIMFLAAGLVPLGTSFHLPAWFNQGVALVVGSALAMVFNWIAFFPGERHFSGAISFLGLQHGAAGAAATGRLVFGIGALLADLSVLNALWRVLRGTRPPA